MKAIILIYKDDTGETVKEIPLAFWFSNAEHDIKDRHFNLEHQNVELGKGENATIIISLSEILEEIKRVMRVEK